MCTAREKIYLSCRVVLMAAFLAFLASASSSSGAEAPNEHDPAAELASFTIAPGFDVTLFASEKDGVIKPIQMRFDPQGRIWVIGSTVYPQLQPGQIPNDKVLVLEDTDHDGVCDKTTVFADGLMIPTGIELAKGGAYIGHGTEMLYLADTNKDLRADERHVVLRGFGTGDNHQNINSFIWGPGGELWFCQGLHTHSNIETPWGIVRMEQAGLWRFQPALKKLEGFFGSVYEPQNPWGYVFTDWGEPIVIAGNNSSIMYPVPGLTAKHFPLAPPLIWKNGGGRKSSGADIVGTAHFPEDWQGVVITGGYINNAVWALEIKEDGSGFALVDREPLIKSSSRNFRPVDVKFGPDGSLYICDWYNPIIGHYQASFRHPDRDKSHGRIWRVTARGRPLTDRPSLADASIPELLSRLESRDRWTRQFAKRALADRNAREVANGIENWRTTAPRTEHALKEALGVAQSHEILNTMLLQKLVHASDPGGRAYAASAVGRWADRLQDPLGLLQPLATDSEPRVRLQAIVASSYIPKWEALEVAALAAELPTDKFIDYALRQAVFALKPYWETAARRGLFTPGSEDRFFNLLVRVGETDEIASVARNFIASRPDSKQALSIARTLIANASASQLDWIPELTNSTLREILLPELAAAVKFRGLKPTARAGSVLAPLIDQKIPAALTLAGLWKLDEYRNRIESAASDKALPIATRIGAISGLAGWKQESASRTLRSLLPDTSPPIRIAAIAALAQTDVDLAAQAATQTELSTHDWIELSDTFLQRKGGAAALAKEFGKKAPDSNVAAGILRLMNETGRRDEGLLKILAREPGPKLTLSDIPALVGEVRSHGNSERGKRIFERAELSCSTCHAVKGQGGAVGPDLGAVGTAQPVDFIIGAILDPQREVKEGYIATSVSTKDGDEFQGYVLRDEGPELVLKDLLQNSVVTIRKDRIDQRRQSGSPMPAGLTDGLSRDEFVDLVKYLSELGK